MLAQTLVPLLFGTSRVDLFYIFLWSWIAFKTGRNWSQIQPPVLSLKCTLAVCLARFWEVKGSKYTRFLLSLPYLPLVANDSALNFGDLWLAHAHYFMVLYGSMWWCHTRFRIPGSPYFLMYVGKDRLLSHIPNASNAALRLSRFGPSPSSWLWPAQS